MHTYTHTAAKRHSPPRATGFPRPAATHADKALSAPLSREEWRRIVMDMIG
jgi:hypothetical protein